MEEHESKVEGRLVRDRVVIEDSEMRLELEKTGYGEESGGAFHLLPFESLYLMHQKRLGLYRAKKKLDFDALMRTCRKYDGTIMTRFLIYRDLRSRGYAVRDGFGFGSDFRVYERGQLGQKSAKYVVFGLSEGTQEKMGRLQTKVQQISQMGKEPIIAVVDRRGEIIYYRISRIIFTQNKAQPHPV